MSTRLPRALAILAVAHLCAAGGASANFVNGSFEDPTDLLGWTTLGTVDLQDAWRGIAPTEGAQQVLLSTGGGSADITDPGWSSLLAGGSAEIDALFATVPSSSTAGPVEGSAIQATFTGAAGDFVEFDWNFVTRQSPPEASSTDFLWHHLLGPSNGTYAGVLAHANMPASSFTDAGSSSFQQTGTSVFSFELPEDGTYTITLGVHDVEATNFSSFGVFDDFRLRKKPEPATALLLGMGLAGLALGRRRKGRA